VVFKLLSIVFMKEAVMSYIATIELKEGCTSFIDGNNSIFLSIMKPTAEIDSSIDLTAIENGIRDKKIIVKKGKLHHHKKHHYKFEPKFFGVDDIIIPIHREFHRMRGVIVMSDGINVTDQVQVQGVVNTNLPGVYTLVYTVSDKAGNTASAERKVTVADKTAPVITGADDLSFVKGTAFDPLVGISVTDNVDGAIDLSKVTVSVVDANGNALSAVDVNTAGIYTVKYVVSDAAGNVASAERKVTVEIPVDTAAPVLSGVNDVEIAVGDSFDPMAGVTAVDDVDGDVTANIQVTLK
jgi:hypothetical protein